jgi:hypothetical protein
MSLTIRDLTFELDRHDFQRSFYVLHDLHAANAVLGLPWTSSKPLLQFRGSQLRNFYAKFIHHFIDLKALLTDLPRISEPHNLKLTLACLEAFENLKFRLFSAPCVILPEVRSDATLPVHKLRQWGLQQ